MISKVQANLGFQKEIYEKFQEKFKAESEVWENFVLEGLEEYQKKQKTNLVGVENFINIFCCSCEFNESHLLQ